MNSSDALCLFRGFSEQQITAAIAAAYEFVTAAGFSETAIYSDTIPDSLLDTNVGEHIETLIRNEIPRSRSNSDDSSSARAVLILTNNKQRLFKIMRGMKSVSEEPNDIIFASITETALTWTFRSYFSHLSAEHEYMKTHSPEGDPDMKAEVEQD